MRACSCKVLGGGGAQAAEEDERPKRVVNEEEDERVHMLELLVGCAWGVTATVVAADRKRRGGRGPAADLRRAKRRVMSDLSAAL